MRNTVYIHQPSERISKLSPSTNFDPQYRLDKLSDTQLIDRCRQNDKAAFEVLIGRYERPIYRLAYHLSRNREIAQDVAAETRYLIYRSVEKLQGTDLMLPW